MAKFTIGIEGTEPTEDAVLAEDVKRGDILYFNKDDLKYHKASSSHAHNSNAALWIADDHGQAGSAIPLVDRGYFYFQVDVELIPGEEYYLSTTPGAITSVPPRDSGIYSKYVGKAINKSKLLFEPSSTYVEGDGKTINGIKIDGDKTYNHKQTTPSTEWVCEHNLGKYPSVTVRNTADDMIVGRVVFDSPDKVTLSFNVAVTGDAFFN